MFLDRILLHQDFSRTLIIERHKNEESTGEKDMNKCLNENSYHSFYIDNKTLHERRNV